MHRRSLFVAGLQTAGIPNDPEATLAQLENRVRALVELFEGVQLVVVPELHLAALPPMLDEAREENGVEIPGPETKRLAALARETGVWLVPGSVFERADEGVYNTALVFSPQGELVASYRKCFPWQPYEKSLPGRNVVTFEIEGVGRLGLAICHDGVFPEVFRQLTWDGAEAILQVSLTRTSDRDAEIVAARANALVNQVFLFNVNAAAPVGNGRSVVIDAEGIVRYEAGASEEVVTALIDFDAVSLVRERGSFGINRLLAQLERQGAELELPMYGGRYRPRPGSR